MSASIFTLIYLGYLFSADAVDYQQTYDVHLQDHSSQSHEEHCSSDLNQEDYILANRDFSYGWGEETHRAVIALVASGYWQGRNDTDQMVSQLELELSKALLKNSTSNLLPVGDLALYIHALIVTGLNPRNFHGEDLVATLQHRFLFEHPSHPFAVLALCNARVLEGFHLQRISNFLIHSSDRLELQAIALKAFACALEEWPERFEHLYRQSVSNLASALAKLQNNDGSFGNPYTTALIVQALVASNATDWDISEAMTYLRSTFVEKNIMSSYITLMALNCKVVKFLKNLAQSAEPRISNDGIPSLTELKCRPRVHKMRYSVLSDASPKINFTASIHMPINCTFFDIMRLVADQDNNFRFTSSSGSHPDRPVSIAGIPNYTQKGFYWKLLSENQVTSTPQIFHHRESPRFILPMHGSHFYYKYINVFDRATH